MNVLHFGRFYDANYGGLERVVGLLLKGLSNSTRVVNLVANDRARADTLEVDGYRVVRAPSLGLVAGTPLCPTMPLWARRLDRQCRFDIAHLHFPDPMSHLAAATLPPHVRLVISWHSDIVRQRWLFKLYRPYLDRILARAHAVIAATPKHFSSSTQLGACTEPERLHVVPYGIDFAPYDDPNAVVGGASLKRRWGSRFAIFAVGRHVYYKGLDHLIRAMVGIASDAVLVVGGTGPLSRSLQKLAVDLGLGGRVIFPGRIPEAELPAYYHAADVFCLPSVERSEAFGLVQVEAMACRKPVVSCELGNGVSYVNRHGVTGFVVPPRDERALGIAINRLLEDHALRAKMGEAGYVRATTEFAQQRMVRETLAVYRTVMST